MSLQEAPRRQSPSVPVLALLGAAAAVGAVAARAPRRLRAARADAVRLLNQPHHDREHSRDFPFTTSRALTSIILYTYL